MTRRLFLVSSGIATVSLTLPFALSRHWVIALVVAVGGLFWWYGWTRKLPDLSTLCLLAVVGFCILGLWINLLPFYYLVGLLAGLTAWDLDRFDQRLAKADRVEFEPVVIRKHLVRVFFVDAMGLIVGLAALLLRFKLTFGWILFLGLVTVVGLSQVYNLFKREIDKG